MCHFHIQLIHWPEFSHVATLSWGDFFFDIKKEEININGQPVILAM